MGNKAIEHVEGVDVCMIGAGVISATLSMLLSELEPGWSQLVLERLEVPAAESSDPWNNAGTGHSALCELNYTPQKNGKVQIDRAVTINERFQISRQFWSYLVEQGRIDNPNDFINPVTHESFVYGADNVAYLRQRYEALKDHPLFPGMGFTDSFEEFAERVPLMAKGRDPKQPVALSWLDIGTDLNFGALTRKYLQASQAVNTEVRYGKNVVSIRPVGSKWGLEVTDTQTGRRSRVLAKFVFVGAGGMALPLLQKAGIPEVKGYGGFPVSGAWLRCTNPEIVEQHSAKVYGKAGPDAPPMSVPHLDTRVIEGRKSLLFGPFAGWSSKFLKSGSWLDLFESLRPGNVVPMGWVGLTELGLLKYLISEVTKNQAQRVETLREFMPEARDEDWELVTAGQRVQVIKPGRAPNFGTLEFGTAVVNNNEGTIAGLMGASPGASIAPWAMIDLLGRCFGDRMITWGPKLLQMVPSYGQKLADNPKLFNEQLARSTKALQLG